MSEPIQLVLKRIKPYIQAIESNYTDNFQKVLKAFQDSKVATHHMSPTFGYGLSDPGIETLESLISHIFKAEGSLVRPQFISGTQALFLVLNTLLSKGDLMLTALGTPYETLQGCIGLHSHYKGNLISQGIRYAEANLFQANQVPLDELIKEAKIIWIQKSCGYSTRKTISNRQLKEAINRVHTLNQKAIVVVDNCYGEFVETIEPIEAGADLCIGSFLKNPGGGIAKTGAYITGKKELLESCASYYVAPGMGYETTPNIGLLPAMFQGIFQAPLTVRESLLGNLFMSSFLDYYDLQTFPKWYEPHFDIVLRIEFHSKHQLIKFAEILQQCSPVDSFAKPTPFQQDGYSSPIIMAGGTFTPGSSIEFSADGFVKYPFHLFFQPGLVFEQTKLFAEILERELFHAS